jgi:hypothetical protein
MPVFCIRPRVGIGPGVWRPRWSGTTANCSLASALCQGKAENDLAKRLANLWRRVNMKKKARAVRGQEIKWEIPD